MMQWFMAVLVIASLVILPLFNSVLCDEHQVVYRDFSNDNRTKRNHESDCPKLKARSAPIKRSKILGSTEQKPKAAPKPVKKEKLPINNELDDVRSINHILEKIAAVANNHNETKSIQKIRHLIDAIDNQNVINYHEPKLAKPIPVKANNVIKLPKEEKLLRKCLKLEVGNETKANETANKFPECKITLKMVPVQKDHENKDVIEIEVTKPLLTERSSNNEVPQHADEISNRNDLVKMDVNNENLIKVKENKYEEELLHTTPWKYTQADMYNNWYNRQSYYPGYYNGPYTYKRSANNIENYIANSITNKPSKNYAKNENHGYDNANSYAYLLLLNQIACNRNGDYTKYRQTWMDRDTIIKMTDPKTYQAVTVNEEIKEITNVKYPDFYRKYYSVLQNKYSTGDGLWNNEHAYYIDHCS